MKKLPEEQRTKLFVAIPFTMFDWVLHWRDNSLKLPDKVELITLHSLNPESHFYY